MLAWHALWSRVTVACILIDLLSVGIVQITDLYKHCHGHRASVHTCSGLLKRSLERLLEWLACLTVWPLTLLQEARHFDGQVLVAREAEGHQTGGASHVVDTYEPVASTGTSITLTASLTAKLTSEPDVRLGIGIEQKLVDHSFAQAVCPMLYSAACRYTDQTAQ